MSRKLSFKLIKNGAIFVKIDKMRKIPIFIILQSLGLTKKKIYSSIKNIDFFINYKNKNLSKSVKKSLYKLNELNGEQNSSIM